MSLHPHRHVQDPEWHPHTLLLVTSRRTAAEPASGGKVAPNVPGRGSREYVVKAVLEAARHLIAERGPSSVSLREIANAAGVNNGLLYQYLGTKDQLVAEVYRRGIEKTATRLAKAASLDEAIEMLLHGSDDADVRLMAWAALDPGTSFEPEPSLDILARFVASADRDRDSQADSVSVEHRITAGLIAMVFTASRVFNDVACSAAGLTGADAEQFDAAAIRLIHRIARSSETE
jgi:AcrR family transcriptional regulator